MDGKLPTGVDRVGQAYVGYYGHRAQAVIRWAGLSWVMPRKFSVKLFAWIMDLESKQSVVKIIASGILTGWFRQKSAGAVLFNTGHSGLEKDNYPAMLRRMGVRPVFVVHDLIPITHPEYCRAGESDKHVKRMDQLLEIGCGVVANSRATLDNLAAFAQKSGRPLPPAVVGLLAPGILALKPGKRSMAAPYFVILSTIEPRKNHVMLLQLWRRLIELHGEQAPRLLVIGQRGWECENTIDFLERCSTLTGFVTEINNCSDQDLITYLHHARALLFPSFVEGYGMPLVEALALGVPVIASDLPVFREIAGSIPEYVNPLDGIRWGQLVMDYAQVDGEPRERQLERMKEFAVPSWSDHFLQVDRLLERVGVAGTAGFPPARN